MLLYCKVRQRFIDTEGWHGFKDMFMQPPYSMLEEDVVNMYFDTVCTFANVIEDSEAKVKIENLTVEKLQSLISLFNDKQKGFEC